MPQQQEPQSQSQFTGPFPSTDDLTHLSMDDARRVLRALRAFVDNEVMEVRDYSRPDRSLFHEWSVWLPITQRHMTLAEWANEWLADQDTMPLRLDKPRFAVGQIVRWPVGHCTFRVAGPPSVSGDPPMRWYGGPIVSGEGMGGYVLSVPEAQLESFTPEGGDAA